MRWILLAAAALVCLWLFLISPRPRKRSLGALAGTAYAHRGLWDGSRPENSLPAFEAAADAGFGIELDVQLTLDDQVMVFHDDDLERMCDANGRICDMTAEQLQALRLLNSGETIPAFADVLETVAGRVPLIVEIKSARNLRRLCERTSQLLEGYPGCWCVESFDPRAVRWFRRHRPEVIRGQLAFGLRGGKYDKRNRTYRFLSTLLGNSLGRPDFIAFDFETERSFPFRLVSRLWHPWRIAWTVCSQREMDELSGRYDLIIFEGFVPRRP